MTLFHRPFGPADTKHIQAFAPDFPAGECDPTVMIENGDVIGYADFSEVVAGRFCHLGHVVVAPQARRRGIAGLLLEAMDGKAFTLHCASELRASCDGANTAGLLLLTSHGFVPVSVEAVGKAAVIHFTRKRPEPRLSDFLNGLEDGDVVPFKR